MKISGILHELWVRPIIESVCQQEWWGLEQVNSPESETLCITGSPQWLLCHCHKGRSPTSHCIWKWRWEDTPSALSPLLSIFGKGEDTHFSGIEDSWWSTDTPVRAQGNRIKKKTKTQMPPPTLRAPQLSLLKNAWGNISRDASPRLPIT